MKKWYLLVFAVAAALLAISFVPNHKVKASVLQDVSMQTMDMPVSENVIDGSKHPEKIKDIDAWFMFLLNASTASSANEVRYLFGNFSLTDDQTAQIMQTVADFNQKFQAVSNQYDSVAMNNLVSGADNTANEKDYLANRKTLVRQAEGQIEDTLGPLASSYFHVRLEEYKKNMKIAVEGDSN